MILTDADQLREALRVALEERDEARAALCAVAERQREACAVRAQDWMYASLIWQGADEAVRATPLVTEGKP